MKNLPLSTLCLFLLGGTFAYSGPINENNLSTFTGVLGPVQDGANGQPLYNAPTGPNVVLDDFTFYLKNTGGTSENFDISLMTWNGGTETILWTSAEQQIAAADTSLTAFTVDPNYTLAGGNTYMMFFSELGLNAGNYGSVYFAVSDPGASPNQYGLFVYNNDTDPSEYTVGSDWGAFIGLGMTYNADFSVPDMSSSALLMCLSMGGIGAMRRWLVKA